LVYYQMVGRLREDLVILSPAPIESVLGKDAPRLVSKPMVLADWFIYQHRQTSLGPQLEASDIVKTISRQELVYEYSYDGVPLMSLYKSSRK
jgi:hypothetical protein